jgi:hypothetical protein
VSFCALADPLNPHRLGLNTMKTKNQNVRGKPSPVQSDTAPMSDEDKLIIRVQQQLDAGQVGNALNLIAQSRQKSALISNAIGVCQLRRGNTDEAVRIFRDLVISEGIHFRQDAPPVFLANFAAALYATGNLSGFLGALDEAGERHPAAVRYREAYANWRRNLSLWQKIKLAFAGDPVRPFSIEPAGDLR